MHSISRNALQWAARRGDVEAAAQEMEMLWSPSDLEEAMEIIKEEAPPSMVREYAGEVHFGKLIITRYGVELT